MTSYSKNKFWFLCSLFIVPIMAVGVYALYLYPLSLEESSLQERVVTERTLLEALKEQSPSEDESAEKWRDIQQHLPVQSMEEQFLLFLDEAAMVNKMEITEIAIIDEKVEINDSANSETINDISTASEESTAEEKLPTGLEKMVISMQIQSPTYEAWLAFLAELQWMERYTIIESVAMNGENDEIRTYAVVVAIYHFPTAINHIDHDPKIVNDQAAGKSYPFKGIE